MVALDWLTSGLRPNNLFPELDFHAKIIEVRPKRWGESRPNLNMQDHSVTSPSLKVDLRWC